MTGRMVVGFLVDANRRVVLIDKTHGPPAVLGRLNGIGGHVEPGETDLQAMVRECYEECGVPTYADEWDHLCTLRHTDDRTWSVVFYRAALDPERLDSATTMTDEAVSVFDSPHADPARWGRLVPNLTWLIPLALHTHDRYEPFEVIER